MTFPCEMFSGWNTCIFVETIDLNWHYLRKEKLDLKLKSRNFQLKSLILRSMYSKEFFFLKKTSFIKHMSLLLIPKYTYMHSFNQVESNEQWAYRPCISNCFEFFFFQSGDCVIVFISFHSIFLFVPEFGNSLFVIVVIASFQFFFWHEPNPSQSFIRFVLTPKYSK